MCLPPADNLRQIPQILKKSGAEYVLIVSGDQIYQMDYRKLLRQHATSHAEVTSPFKGVYVVSRDAILPNIDLQLDMYATTSPELGGYCRTIETLEDYYAANMDFLTDRPGFDPYFDKKLLQASRFAANSRIALGARLSGCKVSGSMIFGGVRIENGAVVEDSVILPGAHIGAGAEVRKAIVVENAVVPPGHCINGDNSVAVFAPVHEPASPRPIRRRCARVATKARFSVVV